MNPKHIPTGSLLLLLLLLLVTVVGAQVTRGGTFTVTVIGTSRTAYDIWPKGTGSMSGEAGDQPPIIVAGQVDVVQDPAGGPYTIGNHPISGGGTLRGDVPPDSSITVATAYYAEVTTDASGYGVVLFQTNHNTATGQQFHIVAENPANPGEDVQVVLGGIPGPTGSRDRPGGEGAPLDGIPTQAPTPMIPLPIPMTMETRFIPLPATTVPAPVIPATVVPTTAPTISPQPMETPTETTPPQMVPLPAIIGIAAVGTGLFLAGKRMTG